MFLVHADLTKSVFAAERPTGLVERKNARQQFPQPQAFGFTDESGELVDHPRLDLSNRDGRTSKIRRCPDNIPGPGTVQRRPSR